MTSWRSRIGAYFLEPPAESAPARQAGEPGDLDTPAEPAAAGGFRAPGEPAAAGGFQRPGEPAAGAEALASTTRAAVLGAPGAAVPLAAACAGELRARERASAAVVCIWRPAGAGPESTADAEAVRTPAPDAPAARPPAGATTPGARRLAARLVWHELTATACGRLAWVALGSDPAVAVDQAQRCLRVAAAPVVVAVAGPRPAAFEPLLAELDLAVAALPADAEPALRELALATLGARRGIILPPLGAGPPRWAAMAGLARLRSLPSPAEQPRRSDVS